MATDIFYTEIPLARKERRRSPQRMAVFFMKNTEAAAVRIIARRRILRGR
jgi:hypothetical protein